MNFFDPACQEAPRTDLLFGICDDRDGKPAYTLVSTAKKWDATVSNPNLLAIQFTAIDKCVIKDTEERGKSRCDGMLTTSSHLYFIELESGASGWIPDAVEQLESTIQLFQEHHRLSDFKHKKAFACNRRHPRFTEIDQATNLRFYRTYKVRLDIQANVVVV